MGLLNRTERKWQLGTCADFQIEQIQQIDSLLVDETADH